MRYIKSAFVGIVVAVVAAVLWVVAVGVLPIVVPMAISKFTGSGGVASASVSSNSILTAALVGFVLGFVWRFRTTTTVAGT